MELRGRTQVIYLQIQHIYNVICIMLPCNIKISCTFAHGSAIHLSYVWFCPLVLPRHLRALQAYTVSVHRDITQLIVKSKTRD